VSEAKRLKSGALCWLRFGKQLPYVATEVGAYSADVAGADLKSLIEIEVKTSEADLRRDFEKKKLKHRAYAGEEEGYANGREWIPNRFFFLVPARLEAYALQYLGEKNPAYGLMVMVDSQRTRRLADDIRMIRRAAYLHRNPVHDAALRTFLKRMGSDLCHHHLIQSEIDGIAERVTDLSKQCIEMRESHDDP
jgi:hypothetical protein